MDGRWSTPRRWLLGVPLALTGCTADYYGRAADESAFPVIEEYDRRTLGGREEWVQYPDPPSESTSDAAAIRPTDPEPVRELSLADALIIAVENNRDYIAQRESLYNEALSLVQAGWDFSPQLSATIGYVLRGGELATNTVPDRPPRTDDLDINFGVSQRFSYGGQLSVDFGTSVAHTDDPLALVRRTYSSNAGIQLSQPLLRGFGYEVGKNALIQAERSMVYAIRDFEQFRQNFSIDVAQQFYDLVQQRQSIDNLRANLDGFVFGRRQAEALFEVGRTNELDVLRARRSELTSRNSLIEAEQGFKLALDRFKIFLGLATSEPIDVLSEAPEFVPVEYDNDSAIEVALHNRLDLITRRQQLEDAERDVRIAKNALLPGLDLDVSYSVGAGPGARFENQGTNTDSYSVGLSLDLPVNRVDEQSAYRRAQIARDQNRRSLEQFEDELVLSVVNSFRQLDRRKQSLDIQQQLIEDQEKNVNIAQLRFEQGKVSNRDFTEAKEALLDAQNSLIQERVSYEIARLQLLRDLGILFIDENGMWIE